MVNGGSEWIILENPNIPHQTFQVPKMEILTYISCMYPVGSFSPYLQGGPLLGGSSQDLDTWLITMVIVFVP